MKKKYISLLFMALVFTTMPAQTDVNFDVNSTNGTGWIGFMNVSNLPAPYGDGAYQFGSAWGTADLVAITDNVANTVTLKPNRIGDPTPFWQTGNLGGNKFMDASFYLEDDTLAGMAFTFNGQVISNTLNSTGLDVPFVYSAFIKVFAPDYSSYIAYTYDLSVGNFSIVLDATNSAPGDHVQYGFNVTGPNIAIDPSFDAAYDALGSIVIGANTTLTVDEPAIDKVVLYPNPAQTQWTVKAGKTITTITVFDVLGKQIMVLNPNTLEATIDASNISKGIYFATIHSDAKISTYRLIKN